MNELLRGWSVEAMEPAPDAFAEDSNDQTE